VKITKDMLDLARHIVEQKSGTFEPEQFEDRYESALVDLIKQKRNGMKPSAKASPKSAAMSSSDDALKRSLANEKQAAPPPPKKTSRRRPRKRPRPRARSRARPPVASAKCCCRSQAAASVPPRKTSRKRRRRPRSRCVRPRAQEGRLIAKAAWPIARDAVVDAVR